MPDPALLITCEHAVNTVPEPWRSLFEDQEELLASHQGWDPGAHELARFLAKELPAFCIAGEVSRLLVDLNRSPQNRYLWSDVSRNLPIEEKKWLLELYYEPFRRQAVRWIAEQHDESRQVVHLSIHSFTPILDGKERDVDVGLLYDPARPDEAFFAEVWKARLLTFDSRLRVRFNVPYRGRSDCHIATYRSGYLSRDYIGLELEVNQARLKKKEEWRRLQRDLAESLKQALYEVSTDE